MSRIKSTGNIVKDTVNFFCLLEPQLPSLWECKYFADRTMAPCIQICTKNQTLICGLVKKRVMSFRDVINMAYQYGYEMTVDSLGENGTIRITLKFKKNDKV